MRWEDTGLLIEIKDHGERDLVIRVFTESHGLCAGLVKGGQNKKQKSILNPGAQLNLVWYARLSDHLGTFQVDVSRSRSILFMGSKSQLYAFNSLCSIILLFLAEREPENLLYVRTIDLLEEIINNDEWLRNYVEWEFLFLQEIGYGLELSVCGVTGVRNNLTHVSPKSGKAVCEEVANPWKDKLFELPKFLVPTEMISKISKGEALKGLLISTHFFSIWALPDLGKFQLPKARALFIKFLERTSS